MLKQALMATVITFAAASAQSQTMILSESFDSVAGLGGSGWVQTNLSSPVGTLSWFQGNSGIFASQTGAPNAYIGANFLSGADGGALANWLISPTFSTAAAGAVTFYARSAGSQGLSDHIAFGLSTGSASTGSFTLGSAVTLGTGWTQYSVNFAAKGAGSIGRFAIEYVGLVDDSEYIGIDTFAVTTFATAPVPEPSTYALMALGITGLAMVRRRRST